LVSKTRVLAKESERRVEEKQEERLDEKPERF
jgi:hypothetical protein